VVGGIRVAAYCAPPPPTRRATAAAATKRPHRVVATASLLLPERQQPALDALVGRADVRNGALEVCGERPLSLDPRPQRIEDEQGEARLGLGDERGPDRRAG
jgi:hypothetical protein